MAGKATIPSDKYLGRSKMLRSVRHYLRVLKSSGRAHDLARNYKRATVHQINTGTVSKATLGNIRNGVGRSGAFPDHEATTLYSTELK